MSTGGLNKPDWSPCRLIPFLNDFNSTNLQVDDDCSDSAAEDEERGTEDEDKSPALNKNAASDPSAATSDSNQEDSQKLIE